MSVHQLKLLIAKRQQQQSQPQSLSLPPPPAYTAATPAPPSLFHSRLNFQYPVPSAAMGSTYNTNGLFTPGVSRDNQFPSPTSDISPQDAVDYEPNPASDFEPPTPSITISISTPISIHGDNNVLSFCPADTSAALAKAMIGALRESSMSTAGIPMIDENGVPRPIHVNVEAGVEVNGAGNRIGPKVEERVVFETATLQEPMKREGEKREAFRKAALDEMQKRGAKRGRDEDEDDGHAGNLQAPPLEGERAGKVKKCD